MKAAPLLVAWHNDNAPIYSAQFEPQPNGKGRLATAGGDNNVRLWKVEGDGESRKVTYLSTLSRHTQAVNVVRWCPRSEILASAGDDGNVLLWVPAEAGSISASFGDADNGDKETWRVKHMCRSLGSEIYDLAWSPDGVYFITGSMDNIARIYNAQTGQIVRQIAEHNHYVQGVAWDPLNEFVATQSSDRSVHIYTLKNKDGQFSLAQHHKMTKMDMPSRRISSSSPAPPDFSHRTLLSDSPAVGALSPVPSQPGTPNSLAPLPMIPPHTTHSRRSSFGSVAASRRSASPAPSLPLPAVMPSITGSPSLTGTIGVKNTNIYANETFTSFFRRLTFAPDGSLLFTPAGQYKTAQAAGIEDKKTSEDTINTVYIYTRAGLNKPPIAYLPGHKKPSLAVKCSKVFYQLRPTPSDTKHITVDTSGGGDEIPLLPEPAAPVTSRNTAPTSSSMDPPPPTSAPSPSPSNVVTLEADKGSSSAPPPGPPPVFSLPYRIVYAVATQDAVYIYDTQQRPPLAIVSNLHYATFTDLSWSMDGQTLLMTSSDGFCSCITFAPNELGLPYDGPTPLTQRISTPSMSRTTPAHLNMQTAGIVPPPLRSPSAASIASTPSQTPTTAHAPAIMARQTSNTSASGLLSHPPAPSQASPPVPEAHPTHRPTGSVSSMTAPSPPASLHHATHSASSAGYAVPGVMQRPSSPTRSMSISSVASSTQPFVHPDFVHPGMAPTPISESDGSTPAHSGVPFSAGNMSSASSVVGAPTMTGIPGVAAAGTTGPGGTPGGMGGISSVVTPPQTPANNLAGSSAVSNPVASTSAMTAPKREGEEITKKDGKKRRIQPTLIGEGSGS